MIASIPWSPDYLPCYLLLFKKGDCVDLQKVLPVVLIEEYLHV